MPELKTYDLFISHAWTYNVDYHRLLDMLDATSNFKYRNYSVPRHDPLIAGDKPKLREELKKQIRPANIVIVLAGMYAAYREWIQFEIDFSEEIEKPIIGIKPWGSERIPEVVQNAAIEIVAWNTDSIVAAIRKHSL